MKNAVRWLSLLCVAILPPIVSAAPNAGDNYEKYCAGCHGGNGKAQTRLGKKSGAKDLTDRNGTGKLTDAEIFQTIKTGRKDKKGEETMEAFGRQLSDPEISALVAYVRRFTK